jgi:thioredoxin 1
MNFRDIEDFMDLQNEYKSNKACLFYFSTTSCNVCKVIKPKLLSMLETNYPEFKPYYTDIEKSPYIAGQMRVFSVPTLIIFLDGKEFYRLSRNISIDELEKTIKRPYGLLF